MAVMRKEQKEIDGLWSIGIIREAFKLLLTHSKFFMMIQLTLMLPFTLVTVATEYLVYWNLPEHNRPPPGAARIPHLPSNFRLFFPESASGVQLGLAMVVILLVSAVVMIFVEAVKSLSSAAILYAVGLHYTGQSISFHDVLHAAIPRLWMRLTVTNIYKVLLTSAVLMGQAVGSFLLIQIHAALQVTLLVVLALGLVADVGRFCLDLVFMLAAGVSVLEKDYGWAAVRRTPKLLKGRVIVAVLFQLWWQLPTFALNFGFQSTLRSQITKSDFSALSLAAFVLGTVVYICWRSFVWQMKALCTGVQYASFKAYHSEDLVESMTVCEKQTLKGAYLRVARESDDAKVGGQKAEALV